MNIVISLNNHLMINNTKCIVSNNCKILSNDNILDHLKKNHHFNECNLLLDDNGCGDLDIKININKLKDNRKKSIIIVNYNQFNFLVIIDIRKRADTELQVACIIQLRSKCNELSYISTNIAFSNKSDSNKSENLSYFDVKISPNINKKIPDKPTWKGKIYNKLDNELKHVDDLISHRNGLLLFYPTNKDIFVENNIDNNILELYINIQIELKNIPRNFNN